MILFRYLSREILASLSANTLVLLIVFITNQFVRYLNEAVQGRMEVATVLKVMGLQVPFLLVYLLPLSFFVAVLLVLGRLCADHEMIVIEACGISKAKILGMILTLAAGIAIFVAVLMFWVEPRMEWVRVKIVHEAIERMSVQKILPGHFVETSGHKEVLYAKKVEKDHTALQQVFWASQSKTQNAVASSSPAWDVVLAEKAYETKPDSFGNRYLIFQNGKRYEGSPGSSNYKTTYFDEYGVRMNFKDIDLSHRLSALPTAKVFALKHKLIEAEVEWQWRWIMPLSVFGFAMIGVPLSYVNPRRGKFAKLFPAIIIYAVFANVVFMGRGWLKQGIIPPWIGLWGTVVGLFVLGSFLMIWRTEVCYRLLGVGAKRGHS